MVQLLTTFSNCMPTCRHPPFFPPTRIPSILTFFHFICICNFLCHRSAFIQGLKRVIFTIEQEIKQPEDCSPTRGKQKSRMTHGEMISYILWRKEAREKEKYKQGKGQGNGPYWCWLFYFQLGHCMLNFGGFIQFVQSGVRGPFGILRWRYWQELVPCASSKNSVFNVHCSTIYSSQDMEAT